MADRKNPLFLRVMIVVVALLLGFSLNMFQFRNPFRSLDTDSASNTQLPDKSRFPSRQETALPVSPVAKPPQPEAAAAKEDKAAPPQTAEKSEPRKNEAVTPAPADATPPAPQGVADATPEKPGKPEKQDSPVSITVEHESPSLTPPKVTSDAGKAKAGKIGRQVATGVAESKPEPKAVAEAPAPVPGAPSQPIKEDKPAPSAAEPAKPSAAPASAENGVAVAQAPQAPQASTPAQAPQTVESGPEGTPAVQTPQASKPGPGLNAVVGKPAKTQASKQAQSDQPAANASQGQPDVSPAAAPSGAQAFPEKAKAEEKPAAARGTKVLEIKTQDKPGEFVLTIVTDGPVEKVTSFHAKGPARLAIDLQGNWQSALGASIPVEGELFERLRLGAHPDKLRLVIDYRDKELSAFSEQIVEKQPKGVVVRIPKAKTKP